MGAHPRTTPRVTLTGQLLIFQLSLLAVVLIAVSASLVQGSRVAFENQEGRRLLAVAENSAALPLLRFTLTQPAPEFALTGQLEQMRTATGVHTLMLTDPDGRVLVSPEDPRLLRTTVQVPHAQSPPERGWSGVSPVGSTDFLLSRAPVLSDKGELVGIIIAATPYPSLVRTLVESGPGLLTFLGVAGVLGAAGSIWLARRMKRQTLGLEPSEIARLVEHREAMLHGIREGIISVDAAGSITLANDSAVALLGLPPDAAGKHIDELGLDDAAVAMLSQPHGEGVDALLINRGRLLALNQTVISPAHASTEIVTTLRDRTELAALQHELGTNQQSTDALRTQTHDFANRLHTISMLIQLDDTEAAVTYIDALSEDRRDAHEYVLARIEDPTVAAVTIAMISVAAERGATLELTADSSLGQIDPGLAADVATVIGNLVDNAVDAVAGAPCKQVTVSIRPLPATGVLVRVRDSGAGVSMEHRDALFQPRMSTKDDDGVRGFGLAIVNLTATRRGGTVRVHNDGGAVFEVELPSMEVAHA